MTELTTTTPRPTSELDVSPTPVAESASESALITEQQVLFSTSAAVAVPAAKPRRWTEAIESVAGAVHGWFAEALKPPLPHHNPKRYDYLENARMSREMDRL
jgi:hypothetical protein